MWVRCGITSASVTSCKDKFTKKEMSDMIWHFTPLRFCKQNSKCYNNIYSQVVVSKGTKISCLLRDLLKRSFCNIKTTNCFNLITVQTPQQAISTV